MIGERKRIGTMYSKEFWGERLIKFIGKVELYVSMSLLISIVGLFITSVALRYVFHKPAMWISSTTTLLFIWASMISISYVYRKRGHIAITFVVEHFPEKLRVLIDIIVYIIIVSSLILLFIGTIKILPIHAQRFIVGLRISRIYFSFAILVSGMSMLITTIYFIFLEIKNLVKKSF